MAPNWTRFFAWLPVGASLVLAGCPPGPPPPTGVTLIAAGGEHTCAGLWDGSMKCWGRNQFGQLGNGTNNSSNVPVEVVGTAPGPVPRSLIQGIAAGGNHTCQFTGGKIFCWGLNQDGQLGLGSTTDFNVPQPVRTITLADGSTALAAAIAAGENHTCALYSPDIVACWGDNRNGQVGSRATDTTRPAVVRGLSANAIAAGGDLTCEIERPVIGPGGPVKCWGTVHYPSPTQIQGLSGITAIAVGRKHACAIEQRKSTPQPWGVLYCWGSNLSGQLGNGTRTTSYVPVAVSWDGSWGAAVALAAGGDHTCAVFETGVVACWGWNDYGQLGSRATDTTRPTAVAGLTKATAVAAGGAHSCARFDDGGVPRLACWGWNGYGQLGNGTNNSSVTPVRVSGLP